MAKAKSKVEVPDDLRIRAEAAIKEFKADAERGRFLMESLGQLIIHTGVQEGGIVCIGIEINPRLRRIDQESLKKHIDLEMAKPKG